MKKYLLAGLSLLAAPTAALAQTAPLPDADPAIWVVKDADTTIYLFGTVHALDGKKDWFNDEVKTAFDQSNEVVFEMLMPDPAKAQAVIMERASDKSGTPLSSKLSPEQAKKLQAELVSVGAPATALDNFDPWFAATQLAMIRFMKQGIKPEHGAETVLREAAQKGGKTMGEVESFDWQINLFDSLPPKLQLDMLTGYLDELEKGDEIITRMMDSWSKGDITTLADVMNEALTDSPELAKILLADRNARWAEWIGTRLDKPGTVFMAVGAGHLGGKDSVQDYLAKKGLRATRLPS